MGKTSAAVKDRYNKKAYDRIESVVPKGRKKDLQEYAAANGTTLNALVGDLLRQALGMSPEEWRKRADDERDGTTK